MCYFISLLSMKKIVIPLIAFLFFPCSLSFAQEKLGNCDLVTSTGTWLLPYQKANKEHANVLQNVLSEEEYERAFWNLQTVCCRNENFQKENVGICNDNPKHFVEGKGPASRFIFDHFFDILMRKLDGTTVYEVVKPDPIASEWYTKLKEIKEKNEWQSNTGIDILYQQYWTPTTWIILGYLNNPSVEDKMYYFRSWDGGQRNNQAILANYSSSGVTLLDRYTNVCNLASFFYFLSNGAAKDFDDITRGSVQNNCVSVVETRIGVDIADIIHTKVSSNLRYFQNRTQNNLAYIKLRNENLSKTLVKISDSFANVMKLSQKITPNCK